MTIHKEDAATDVDAVQVWSVKELEGEFTPMLKAYHDKETEFNWEARDKSITRLRGLLRGNATESPYLEVLLPGLKQLVDGIVKAVESLRTQLAVKSLLLIEDIGIFVGKHLDNYTIDQILLCMMRCSSLSKKLVASASFKATNIFLRHTHFYPKIANMLNLSMNEKNSQVRLYAVGYLKTVLQTHAHNNHARITMDRTNGVIDHFESILTRGLNDPTPVVKEACREAFWIFWEHWREKGDYILKQLPPIAQKQLEKSKHTQKRQSPIPTSSKSLQMRASSSLGKNHHHHQIDIHISPTNSNHSNESVENTIKRSISPQARSTQPPPLPSSLSAHLQQQQQNHSNSTTTTNIKKTRVPTLHRKKSAVGLISKRRPHFMTLVQNDDIMLRADGYIQLAKKLSILPYTPTINLNNIQIDIPNAPPLDGEGLKSFILNQWEENYEILSSWDCVTNIMIKLLNFEEYIPKLILDAHVDESNRRSESDIAKHRYANLALVRAKLYLQCENPDLVDTLFTSLVQYGGFVTAGNTTTTSSSNNNNNKKDITRLPANRRKLTKQFLDWMDELVTPLIGLNEDIDYTQKPYEGVPDSYTVNYIEKPSNTVSWFESDDNVRQCLAILLPWTISTSGTIWHLPLVTFIKHVRLLNQRLFEMVTATYDDASISKICRTLGIHIRVEPPITIATSVSPVTTDILEVDLEKEDLAHEEEPVLEEEELNQEEEPVLEEEEPVLEEQPIQEEEAAQEDKVKELAEKEAEGPVREEIQEAVQKQDEYETNLSVSKLIEDPMYDKISEPDFEGTKATEQSPLNYTEEDNAVKPEYVSKIENTKLSIQERNSILDHLPTIENTESARDYFSLSDKDTVTNIKAKDETLRSLEPTSVYQEYNEKATSIDALAESDLPPNNILYKSQNDASVDNRTVSNACTEPVQQKQQQSNGSIISSLPCSIPNPEKYPVPNFVSFFAPEKVNYPNPVFRHNARTMITSNGSTTTTTSTVSNNRNMKDKTVLLYALIDKLKLSSSDHHQTFRKLIRLCKEVPIRRRWDQGGIEENGSETWAGAQGDAGNFVELVQAILFFLNNNINEEKYLNVCLECIRQLAVTQAGLFRFYERKVDDKGMTLESQLMEKLLQIRSNENPTICIAAEDALDSILGTLNPPTAFEMLMAFIIHRLLISPSIETSTEVRYHPVGSAFMYLGKWVKEMNDTFYIDEWLGKGGINAFFKGINHPMINIRKSCIEAMVAFHEVIGDDIYQSLIDLREDQSNLLRHYVAKSLKKKASLRNLRDNNNGQF